MTMLTNTPSAVCKAIEVVANHVRNIGGKLNSIEIRDIDGRTMPEVIGSFSISYGFSRRNITISARCDETFGEWNYYWD